MNVDLYKVIVSTSEGQARKNILVKCGDIGDLMNEVSRIIEDCKNVMTGGATLLAGEVLRVELVQWVQEVDVPDHLMIGSPPPATSRGLIGSNAHIKAMEAKRIAEAAAYVAPPNMAGEKA